MKWLLHLLDLLDIKSECPAIDLISELQCGVHLSTYFSLILAGLIAMGVGQRLKLSSDGL